jgi:hypothetical protein
LCNNKRTAPACSQILLTIIHYPPTENPPFPVRWSLQLLPSTNEGSHSGLSLSFHVSCSLYRIQPYRVQPHRTIKVVHVWIPNPSGSPVDVIRILHQSMGSLWKKRMNPSQAPQLASSCPGQPVSMYLSQIAILCFPYLPPAAAANNHQLLLVIVCPQNHLILLDSHRWEQRNASEAQLH